MAMWCVLMMLACAMSMAHGHGRLADPVGRGSVWRLGYSAPTNYDDDGLNCGGFYQQWGVNDGKCGICGDAYDLEPPRPHELGGTYGLGYIVASYTAGDVVPIKIYLSVSHRGYWELRICPDATRNDQECFDQNLLELEDGSTKYYPQSGSAYYTLNYRIPSTLTCEHCVLQWRYTAGNNWGVCEDGTGALGCGNQETFYACSDIAITGSSSDTGSDDNFIPVVVAESNDIVLNEDIPLPLLYHFTNGHTDTKALLHLLLKDIRHQNTDRTKYTNKHKRKRRRNDRKPQRCKRRKVTHKGKIKTWFGSCK